MRGIAFVVVRGPALAGKTAVAQALARRLEGKVACISQDDVWERWITGHDDDLAAETALVYRLIRLIVAAYIRDRYHVIVDAPFAVYRDGVAATHDSDLRELLGLISTIPDVRPLFVTVDAPLETLRERARASERWDERAVEAMQRAFEDAPQSPVALDTSVLSPDECVDRILPHLGAAP